MFLMLASIRKKDAGVAHVFSEQTLVLVFKAREK